MKGRNHLHTIHRLSLAAILTGSFSFATSAIAQPAEPPPSAPIDTSPTEPSPPATTQTQPDVMPTPPAAPPNDGPAIGPTAPLAPPPPYQFEPHRERRAPLDRLAPTEDPSTNSPAALGPFAPPPPSTGEGGRGLHFRISPFFSVVGGAKVDTQIQPPSVHRDARASAIMIADFGFRGEITDWASFESEIMANGGKSLHGTSVYDGQAALQIRKQVLHLGKDWWMVEVGRVIDEASVDYFSIHVADTFLQDTATRDSFLFDGFNLGNGVRGTAEVLPGLRLGLSANAGNPTSTSSIIALGGAYPPYSRIYYQAAQITRTDINGYPDDQFQSYVVTPSVLYNSKYVEGRFAAQMFVVDPNSNDQVAKNLYGYNLRLNLRGHILDDLVSPYFNIAGGRNDVVDPTNVSFLSPDKAVAISAGGGLDVNYQKKFGNYNGVGVQFMENQQKTGDGPRTQNRYFNVGTTYWLHKNIAAGARFALWSSQTPGIATIGERSGLLTLRLVL